MMDAPAADLWVFAYGSLMWRPDFPFEEQAGAQLFGWHRSLCILSTHYRGTETRPGLVLGLDKGGSCRGIAFHVAPPQARQVMEILHEREMITNAYRPLFAPARLDDGRRVMAYAFTARPDHPQYAGRKTMEEAARLIRQGKGESGLCRDYLAATVEHLTALGIEDGTLHRILRLVDQDPGTGPHGEAIAYLKAADEDLARLIERVGPCRLAVEETDSLFLALARAIVYQQLSGKAAATIFGRFLEAFAGIPSPRALLDAPDGLLRQAGLSRPKILALRDLAAQCADGRLPDFAGLSALTDEEIVTRLTGVRGIGRWTAEMLLIFSLGRPDILPCSDLGIRKGFQIAFATRELPDAGTLEKRARRWRPYRTLASWYLWRANELPRS